MSNLKTGVGCSDRGSFFAILIIMIILVSGLASGIIFIPSTKSEQNTHADSVRSPIQSPIRSVTPSSVPSSIPSTAAFDYLVVIMMENKNFFDIINNVTNAPYTSSLANQYAYATNYQFVSNFGSQPNYHAMISGNPEDGIVTTDSWARCNSTPANCASSPPPGVTPWPLGGSTDPTLVQLMEPLGITWKAYMDLMPSNCYQSDSPSSTVTPAYEPHHDPFVWYAFAQPGRTDCNQVVPAGTSASALISDLNSASPPNFMWLSPDNCNDMENCDVKTGDTWLSGVIPNILNSITFKTQKAALFLTWDEERNLSSGRLVPAIWAGPSVKSGYVQTTANAYNHYSLTRTVQVEWNLSPCLAASCSAPPMTEFFNPPPDFSISASSPPAVIAGQSAGSTITVTAVNGFTGPVTLSDSVPTGLTCSAISPGTLSGGSGTATFSCNSSSAGSYDVTITGTSGSLTHTTTATYVFTPPSDFSISASPTSLTVNAGSAGTSAISVTAQSGFSGVVSLSTNNSACSLSPTTVTGSGSSTLSCMFNSGSTIPVIVTGVSGSLSHAITVTYTVQDFTATAAPNPVIVNVNSPGTSTITISAVNGFTGTVALSQNGGPSCSLSQVSVTLTSTATSGSATLTCTFSSATTNSVTVSGTLGSLSHTAIVSFQVGDFTVGASPTRVTVNKGSPGTSTIALTPVNGFTGTVTLNVPSALGLNCNLAQTSLTLGSSATTNLTCTLLESNPVTTTVTGTSGGISHTVAVTFADPPDFNVTASPVSVSVSDGTTGGSTITVGGIGNFNGTVNLSHNALPSNLSCTFTPTSISLTNTSPSGTSTLSCTSTRGGTFPVTITGTNGTLTHTASLTFTFLDFTVSATSPSAANAGQTSSSTITVAGTGFAGTVSLSATTVPTGLSCIAISPPSVPGSGTATLSCVSNSAGTFIVTVTGTSGSLSHTTTATFNFVDFTMSTTSPSSSVGSPAVSTITISGVNGFGGTVTLTNSAPPSGLVCQSISQTSITGSGTATLSCTSTNPNAYSVTITGTSGSLSHSTTATFTFGPAADFTISASSPTALNAGQTTTSTITITAVNGFTGTVSLTDTATSGLTCQAISPTSISGGGTATVACTASTANTYTLTVSGTSGALTHAAAATFNFQDFSIVASSPTAVNTGQSAISTITVTALNGFAGTVQLTDTVPSGLTCNPTSLGSVSGSGTATVSCSSTTPGTFSLPISGTSGSLTHPTSASFTFNAPQDFTISATSPATVNAGQTATSTITITAVNGFTGTVGLTDTVPSGLGCATISPNSVTGSGTATLNCSSSTPGSFTVTITGASGSISHSTTAPFTFNAPRDFAISATSPVTVSVSSTGTSTLSVTALNGFTGTVSLTDTVPSGLNCGAIVPNSITNSGTATLSCTAAVAGNYVVTIAGTSGSLSHSTTATFQVEDFALTANPSSVTTVGGTGTSTISTTALNGFSGTINLSANNPACSISPPSVTGSGSATLTCTFTTTTIVTVTGTSGSLSRQVTVTFTPTNFTIAANPLSVNASPTGSSTITVTPVNGFTGTVNLGWTGGAGLSCSLNPTSVTGSGTSTLSCTIQAGTASAVVTVTGTSGSISHSVQITFNLQSYTVSASPLTATINAGSVALFNVTITPGTGGFTGTVTLSAIVTPSTSPTTSFSPPSVTLSGTAKATSQLSVITYSTTAQGAYSVTVSATSGAISQTATVTVNVGSAFSVAVPAPPQRINVGSSATPSVSVASTGFSGPVSLSATVSPAGPSAVVSPASVSLTPGSTATTALTITVPLTTLAGNYTFTVTGASGSVSHAVTFIVAVSDFSIYATPINPSTFAAGASGISTITLTSLGGFPGTVTLTYSISPGVAGGPTASFVPSSQVLSPGKSSTAIMTISTTTLTPPGKYNITVTGNSNLLSHQLVLSFSLSGFTISVNPSTIPILPGNTGSATITVTGVFGFSGNVSLTSTINSVGSAPSPLFVVLTPTSPVATSSLRLFTSSSLNAGDYDGTVKGTITLLSGATLSQSAPVIVHVTEFSISANTLTLSAPPGASNSTTITFTGLNGFTGIVALTATVSSSELTASITPSRVVLSPTIISATSTLNVLVASTATAPSYSVVVTGVNGTLSRSVTITISVGGLKDFKVSASSTSLVVLAGSSTTSTITISSLNNFAGTVSLSATVAPAGPAATLNPTSVSVTATVAGSSTLTFRSTTHGTYSVTVNATGTGPSGLLAHWVVLTITVTDFSLSTSTSSFNVDSGAPGSFSVTVASQDGFSGNVTLSEVASPTVGLTVACSPVTVTIFANGASSSTCTTSSSTHGTYTVTIKGSSGALQNAATPVTINVVDFAISASPLSLPISQGAGGLSTITLTSVSGFSGIVQLTASLTPIVANGPSTALSPSSLQLLSSGTSMSGLTVSTKSSTPLELYNITITGTSGSLVRTVTVTVNVTAAPDFTISASPSSLEFDSGSSSLSQISLSSLNGFSGTVTLTYSISVAGASASLNPPTVNVNPVSSGTSTLTVQSSIYGDYSVTVGGTSGALSHSVTITVRVVDFGLSTSHLTLTTSAGIPAASDTTLASLNGFRGNVTLTAHPSAGLTATPTSQTVSLVAGGTAPAVTTVSASLYGTYTLSVTATSGTISHSLLVTVTVVDFTISASPPSVSILAGSSGTSTISLNGLNGFSGTITLSATSTGLSAVSSPNSVVLSAVTVSATSTLTISASATTLPGTYTVAVTGTSGLLTHSASIVVTVSLPPDFSVSANPTSLTFPSGSSSNSAITIASRNGFIGNVTLTASVSGGPGATVNPTFVTLTVGGSATATLTVFTLTSVSPGAYTVTVTGSGTGITGPISRSATVSLQLTGFTMAATPSSLAIQAGSSGTTTITISGLNGFTGNVDLAGVGSRSGLNATLNPAIVSISTASSTSTLTVSVDSTVTQGVYSATVTGSVGALTHSVTITLTVGQAKDFTISASPQTLPILRTTSGSVTLTLTSLNGFSGTVALSVTVSSPGFVPSVSPPSVLIAAGGSATATVDILTSLNTPLGSYTITVTANGPVPLTHTVGVSVTVDDFSISTGQGSITIQSGASGAFTITVASQSGFAGTVSLSVSVSPSGPAPSLSSASVPLAAGGSGSTTLTVITAAAPPGPYTVTVLGASGTVSHNVNVTINIVDFNIGLNPSSVTFAAGSSTTSSVTFTSLGGFSGNINLVSSPSGPNLVISCNPTTVFVSSGSTASTSCKFSSSSNATYTADFTATNAALVHMARVFVTVTVAPDFSISSSQASLTVQSGFSNSSTITLTSLNGFSGAISLQTNVSPSGTTATLTLTQVTLLSGGSALSTLTIQSSIPANYGITITATSGSLSHSITVSVRVVDFGINADHLSLILAAGVPGTANMLLTSINGFSGTITLSPAPSSGLTSSLNSPTVTLAADSSASDTITISAQTFGSYSVTVTGKSGSLSHSVTVTVTVVDFSISANPSSLSVQAGTPGTSTIAVSGLNGFSGTITLTTTSPSGLSASPSPTSVPLSVAVSSGISTLTVQASPTLPPAIYSVTITGSSSGLIHATTLQVTVSSAPNFGISASPTSMTIPAGSSGTSTITLTSLNGFSGTVSLTPSTSGGPGATLGVSSLTLASSGSASTTLTILTRSTVSPGTYTVTITGSGNTTTGTVAHSTGVTVVVTDFSLTSNPSSVSFQVGSQGNSSITVTGLNGFSGTVALTYTTSKSGLVVSLNPQSLSISPGGLGNATLDIASTKGTPTGSYTVTVTGSIGTSFRTTTVTVSVGAIPDFTILVSPVSLNIPPGASATATIALTSVNSFDGNVVLSAIVSPLGPQPSLNPTMVLVSPTGSANSILTIVVAGTVPSATYTVTVTASSPIGPTSHTVTVTINVVDFGISSTTTGLVIEQGSPSTVSLTLTSINGFSGQVALTPSSVPGGLSLTTNPSSVAVTAGSTVLSTLSVSVTGASPPGQYTVTITGTNGPLSHSATITVNVVDFSISSNPQVITFGAGANGTATITLAGVNGFSGSIALAPTVSTPGLTSSVTPSSITISQGGSATATLTVTSLVPATFTVVITATSGTLSHSVQVPVRVVDFSIASGSTILTVLQGAQVSTDLTLSSIDDFSGTILLMSSASPTGLVAAPSPGTVVVTAGSSGKSTLTVSSTSVQTYTVTVTGTSGSLSHSVTITIDVVDFSINTSPNSITIAAGTSGTATVTLGSINGFSNTIILFASPSPSGLSTTPSPSNVLVPAGGSSTSTLTVFVPSSATLGPYVVTVTGTSGGLSHSVPIALTVGSPLGFTIAASPQSVTLQAGSTNSTSLTLTSLNGFSGVVALTATNTAATLNPTRVTVSPGATGTSTVTFTSTVAGLFTVTIIGTSGSLSQSVIISVNVVDFRVDGQPISVKTQAGVQGTAQVTATSVAGFSGAVSLTVSSSLGLMATLSAGSVTLAANQLVASTLTVSAPTYGTFSVIVTGTSGSLTHSVTITVIVVDFTISATPTSLVIQQGSSSSTTITITGLNGFCCSVNVAAVSYPGLIALFSINPLAVSSGTATSTLTIFASSSIPVNSYSITVTGTASGGSPHSITIALTVSPAQDFTVVPGLQSLTVQAGFSNSTTLTLTSLNGFSGVVTLSTTQGGVATVNPNAVTLLSGGSVSSMLTITSAVAGSFSVTVTASSGSTTRAMVVSVSVVDFRITGPSTIKTQVGMQASQDINLMSMAGFSGIVTLSLSPSQGLSALLSSGSVTLPANQQVPTSLSVESTIPGTYSVVVTGTSGLIVRSTTVSVIVQDYNMISSPASVTIVGGTSTSASITLTSDLFCCSVSLSASVSVPGAGVSASVSPSQVPLQIGGTGDAVLVIVASTTTPGGIYVVTVTGASGGGLPHTASVTVTVSTDFAVSTDTPSLSFSVGGSGISKVTVTSVGVAGTIGLSVISLPSGPFFTLSRQNVTLAPGQSQTITLTVLTNSTAQPGTYTITLTAASGSLSRILSIVLVLGPAPQIFVPLTCAALQNSSCQTLSVDAGKVIKFQVNATDMDPSRTLTLTVVSSSLPAGASFTPVSGTGGLISGLFNWVPSAGQGPGDYVVTFTVTDGHGGSSTAQVSIHVNGVNRSSSLPSLGVYWYGIFAALGAGIMVVGDRVLKLRRARLAAAATATETN